MDINLLLLISSAALLGVFLGAQIAEACLFVPIWKQMDADDFFAQHSSVGPLIYRFFAPLTIAATFVPLATVVYNLLIGNPHTALFLLLGGFTLAFFLTYPLYFKAANQKFADRSLSNEELPKELERWGAWHWMRIGFETIAFLVCLYLLHIV